MEIGKLGGNSDNSGADKEATRFHLIGFPLKLLNGLRNGLIKTFHVFNTSTYHKADIMWN